MKFSQHCGFSPTRIFAIAGNTLTELTRQKVFYILLIFALVLIGSSVFLARFSFQEELQILKDVALGTMSIFSILLAILATAWLISNDIEARTIYTILAKPVPRYEYLLGKLIGALLFLAITIAVMFAASIVVLYFREQTMLNETAQQMSAAPSEQVAAALQSIRAAGLKIETLEAAAVIYIKACLFAALTLFISTFATSGIFTIFVSVFVYFIGHLQSTAREYWLQQQSAGWLTHVLLAFVALCFPDLQAFSLPDAIAAGSTVPAMLFAKTILLGIFYTAIYTLAATFVFYGKEL